jgi:hypothetical protein
MPTDAAPLALVPTEDELGGAMANSLAALLDQVRGARDVLPHLAALEGGLVQFGAGALDRIPRAAVSRMYSQLVSLPVATDDRALLTLRARLSALLERQRADEREARAITKAGRAAPEFLSTFTGDDRLVVSEASHSSFLAELEAHGQPAPGAAQTAR